MYVVVHKSYLYMGQDFYYEIFYLLSCHTSTELCLYLRTSTNLS